MCLFARVGAGVTNGAGCGLGNAREATGNRTEAGDIGRENVSDLELTEEVPLDALRGSPAGGVAALRVGCGTKASPLKLLACARAAC